MRMILAAITAGVLILYADVNRADLCAAVDRANLCQETKAKTAGKKARDLLMAFGRNLKMPDPAKLAEDVSKADSKFMKKFTKAEKRVGCLTTGDADAMEAKVDAAVADLVEAITDRPLYCCNTHPGAIGFATIDIPERPKCGEMRNFKCAQAGTCYNGPARQCVVDSGCTGSVCGGGSADGNFCIDHSNCPGGTCAYVCDGGTKDGSGCADNSDCPGGSCVVVTTVCKGGARDRRACAGAADCPGGTCITPTCDGEGNFALTSVMCLEGGPASQCQLGTCIVGPNRCSGDLSISCKVCLGGVKKGQECTSNSDCPGSACGTDDNACVGTCVEQTGEGLPYDLACGALYTGGGLNSVPLPLAVPDKGVTVQKITDCSNGIMTVGPAAQTEIGSNYGPKVCVGGDNAGVPCVEDSDCSSNNCHGAGLNCSEGKKCDPGCTAECISPNPGGLDGNGLCAIDNDCGCEFGSGCCIERCLFGAPLPIPNTSNVPTSVCVRNVIAKDTSGWVDCQDGGADVTIPIVSVIHVTGDLMNEQSPPDVPGVQTCPLCTKVCDGGANAGSPCVDDSECSSNDCTDSEQCVAGPNDGLPCTPQTSRLDVHKCCVNGTKNTRSCNTDADCAPPPGPAPRCEQSFASCAEDSDCNEFINDRCIRCAPGCTSYPTSHDCPPDPSQDITFKIGGLPIDFSLTDDYNVLEAADLSTLVPPHEKARRVFCGYCRDLAGAGSLCFEGDLKGACPAASPPANGIGVACTSDADCAANRCLGGLNRGDICTDDSDCPGSTCVGGADQYESCSQFSPGAFSKAQATTFWSQGETDGQGLDDYQCHQATLVGVFCIPPTFDATIDNAGDLPGPAVSNLIGYQRISSTPDDLDPGTSGTICGP